MMAATGVFQMEHEFFFILMATLRISNQWQALPIKKQVVVLGVTGGG
jgi:hypothetical protein